MKATIWHNPDCGTSRKALARLQEAGYDITIVNYKAHAFTREQLEMLFSKAGLTVNESLRIRGTPAEELGLTRDANAEDILSAMVICPILVERPFVETTKGVRLCRPVERIEEII